MKHSSFSPHLIENAVDTFDSSRTSSENKAKMMDHIAQFTGNLGPRQKTELEFALDDEMRRRSNIDDPLGSR